MHCVDQKSCNIVPVLEFTGIVNGRLHVEGRIDILRSFRVRQGVAAFVDGTDGIETVVPVVCGQRIKIRL